MSNCHGVTKSLEVVAVCPLSVNICFFRFCVIYTGPFQRLAISFCSDWVLICMSSDIHAFIVETQRYDYSLTSDVLTGVSEKTLVTHTHKRNSVRYHTFE